MDAVLAMIPACRWLFALVFAVCVPSVFLFAQAIPMTGDPVPELAAYDAVMTDVMTRFQIPGGALAVAIDGRLVLARGYGYADREARIPVQPDSLFRIASISKPLTATAVLKLIEEGKLTLATRAFAVLSDLKAPPGVAVDPRVATITIQNLLEHQGGWDADATGYDPMFDITIASKMGVEPPASAETVIRYMLGRPLDFSPGTRTSYSNFGYCVLGRVIERVSGRKYAEYVAEKILRPAGAWRTRQGKTAVNQRGDGEVLYYDYPGNPKVGSVLPSECQPVAWPDGGFSLEASDSAGGWVSSTIDLLRFLHSMNGKTAPAILNSPPAGFVGYVPPTGNDRLWVGLGSLPGSLAVLRLWQRVTWSMLFNMRPAASVDDVLGYADTQLKNLVSRVSWPSGDAFSKLPVPPNPATAASAASYTNARIACGSITSAFGSSLSSSIQAAGALPLPTRIAETEVRVRDAAGVERVAPLFYVSPSQVNFLVPDATAPGRGTLTITNGSAPITQAFPFFAALAPALFTADASGGGYPAAYVQRVRADGTQAIAPVVSYDSQGNPVGLPISFGSNGDRLYLSLFGTGIRNRSSLGGVTATIGCQTATVLYAGQQGEYPGLDQVVVQLDRSMAGRGRAYLNLSIDGMQANPVALLFQ